MSKQTKDPTLIRDLVQQLKLKHISLLGVTFILLISVIEDSDNKYRVAINDLRMLQTSDYYKGSREWVTKFIESSYPDSTSQETLFFLQNGTDSSEYVYYTHIMKPQDKWLIRTNSNYLNNLTSSEDNFNNRNSYESAPMPQFSSHEIRILDSADVLDLIKNWNDLRYSVTVYFPTSLCSVGVLYNCDSDSCGIQENYAVKMGSRYHLGAEPGDLNVYDSRVFYDSIPKKLEDDSLNYNEFSSYEPIKRREFNGSSFSGELMLAYSTPDPVDYSDVASISVNMKRLFVPVKSFRSETFYPPRIILTWKDQFSNKAEFSECFPELYNVLLGLESLDLKEAEAYIEKLIKESSPVIEIFGATIRSNLFSFWGGLILIFLQLYFIVYYRMFSKKVKGPDALEDISWLALYSDAFSKIFWIAINAFTPVTVLVVLVLTYPYLTLSEKILAFFFLAITMLLFYYILFISRAIQKNKI
jgi:hypothetical protein